MAQWEIRPSTRVWVCYGLQAVGFLSIALGVIGIFLSVLPTTPFPFLTVAYFMHNSLRFCHQLVGHPQLGPWICDCLDGEGIPLKGKVCAIGLIWANIALSCYLIQRPWAQGFILTSAVLVSIYIPRQKTRPPHDA